MKAKFKRTKNQLGRGLRLCVAIFFSLSLIFSTASISGLAHQVEVDQAARERVSLDEGSVIRLTNNQSDNNQTQSPVYSLYLPLIMNGNPPPSAFNKNAPASGTTGASLSPVLSWNTSTNATKYEYCYDTTNDGTCSNWISTGMNNWAGLSGLQQGTTYYWQVRAWNGTYGPTYANGSASAYWSFTTVILVPGAFNKNAPASGTTGTSLSPVLSWNTSTNATKYEYCYDTTNDGTCSNWISTGTNNWAGLSGLQPVTTYYWQVRAWNGTYGPTYANSSSTAYWSFSTEEVFEILPNFIIYKDEYDYGHFVGEIVNYTYTNAQWLSMDINLWDANDNLLGTDYGFIDLDILHQGEKTCFDIWFDYPVNFAYLTIDTISYYETTETRYNITASSTSGSYDSYGYYHIIGMLKNNEIFTVDYPRAISTIYSTTNKVAACSLSFAASNSLNPGGSSSFNDYIMIPGDLVVRDFIVQTDASVYTSQNREEPTTVPLEFHDPTIYWLTDLSYD